MLSQRLDSLGSRGELGAEMVQGARQRKTGILHLPLGLNGIRAELVVGGPADQVTKIQVAYDKGLMGEIAHMTGKLRISAAKRTTGRPLVAAAAHQGQVDRIQQLPKVIGWASQCQGDPTAVKGLLQSLQPRSEVMRGPLKAMPPPAIKPVAHRA